MLTIWFVSTLTILTGCKKKEQPEEARQVAPTEETKRVSASEKIELRILYASLPNTERSKDFVDFLSKHFERVETTDYNTFFHTGDQSADFDVTIIDHDGLSEAHGPDIRSYSHAAITVGVPGAYISDRLGLKTAYL
ncbi:unnamed protein product [marine sediment metagenome]|uniref:Uncharacterized protein n=1 Tax=marine sediment metagenome TaxID=412755 RepID=X0UQF9_9ZZZZ